MCNKNINKSNVIHYSSHLTSISLLFSLMDSSCWIWNKTRRQIRSFAQLESEPAMQHLPDWITFSRYRKTTNIYYQLRGVCYIETNYQLVLICTEESSVRQHLFCLIFNYQRLKHKQTGTTTKERQIRDPLFCVKNTVWRAIFVYIGLSTQLILIVTPKSMQDFHAHCWGFGSLLSVKNMHRNSI